MNRILVVGPAWVGDMVMAQTLFMQLKKSHASAHIDVLAPEWSKPLLNRMPEVHSTLSMPLGHGRLALGVRRRLGRSLRTTAYDQAIVLPNSLKSALVPFWAKIPKRTGWLGEHRYGLLNDWRKLDKSAYPLMVQRFMALAFAADDRPPFPLLIPRLRVNSEQAQQSVITQGLHTDQPILVLAPGAEFGPAKCWPEAHYGQVATHYIHQGWQVWLVGSANDQTIAQHIIQQVPSQQHASLHDLTGKTTLDEAVDLMAQAQAVISNDSGLMHIAAALDLPLVAIYGSTSPAFTPPLHHKKAIVRLDLPCSPCFKRTCPLKHLDCLRKLSPDTVLAALDGLLNP